MWRLVFVWSNYAKERAFDTELIGSICFFTVAKQAQQTCIAWNPAINWKKARGKAMRIVHRNAIKFRDSILHILLFTRLRKTRPNQMWETDQIGETVDVDSPLSLAIGKYGPASNNVHQQHIVCKLISPFRIIEWNPNPVTTVKLVIILYRLHWLSLVAWITRRWYGVTLIVT